MTAIDELIINRSTSLLAALTKLEKTAKGILLLINEIGHFERTVTDGDLRRLLLSGSGLNDSLASLPHQRPEVIKRGYTRQDALAALNRRGIHHLPVVDENGKLVDLLYRKDLDQILLSTPHMGEAEKQFVEEAFASNWIAPLGPNVDQFEKEVAEFVSIDHAAALSSGTAAIHLGLRLLNVGAGDRVFCSNLTFAASAFPILYQGAEPIFIDSDEQSWNLCPLALERAFKQAAAEGWRPKAIIVVNLYGQSADMDAIIALANHYQTPILEDAAESLGAKYKGKASGTFGKLGVFSFNGNKIITTSGGGMLVSDDEALISRAKFLATQARDPALHYQHSELGYNYRMSNILAGVGRGQLKVLAERVSARRKIFDIYRSALADVECLSFMPEPKWSFANRWLTVARLAPQAPVTALELIGKLADEMIEARPVWKPMNLQPIFEKARYVTHGNESISSKLFDEGICLPSGSNMTEGQIARVVETIKSILAVTSNKISSGTPPKQNPSKIIPTKPTKILPLSDYEVAGANHPLVKQRQPRLQPIRTLRPPASLAPQQRGGSTLSKSP